jgi:hypothetical protein
MPQTDGPLAPTVWLLLDAIAGLVAPTVALPSHKGLSSSF